MTCILPKSPLPHWFFLGFEVLVAEFLKSEKTKRKQGIWQSIKLITTDQWTNPEAVPRNPLLYTSYNRWPDIVQDVRVWDTWNDRKKEDVCL